MEGFGDGAAVRFRAPLLTPARNVPRTDEKVRESKLRNPNVTRVVFRFFPNEVMRVPLYEVVPIELIMSQCWVLDLNTYCKGRPLGAKEDHVYICEYRVDKSARLFSKISKSKFPICTKMYAFERFDARLKISRTYTPHDVDQNVPVRPRGRKPVENEENHKEHHTQIPEVIAEVPIIRVSVFNLFPGKISPMRSPMESNGFFIYFFQTREEQRAHLNGILLRLLGRLPTKQALDVSYLLEGGRRRKKLQS